MGRKSAGYKPTTVEFGCEQDGVWYDCDCCPFPDCKISMKKVLLRLKLKEEALQLLAKGATVDEVVKKLGKSKRIILRWIQNV